MDRRVFMRRIGVAALALTTGAVSLQVAAADPASSAMPSAETASASGRIDVLVLGAGGKPYTLTFGDAKPQRVPGADSPLAVAFEPHDAETVKMSLFEIGDDGATTLVDYSYAGRNSTQNLAGYGVTFRVVAVD